MGSSLQKTVNWIKGAMLIVLVVLLFDGMAEQFLLCLEGGLDPFLLGCVFLIPVVAVSLISIWLIFRDDNETYLTKVALAIIAFSLLCRLVWISCFDSYQVSDFGMYLNYATDSASDLFRRSAFYTYPLVLLFGKSLLALKVTNVLLVTLMTWIFFLAGRLVVGTRVAAISLLFFIWDPDLWYSVNVASHDIPGLFWLAVFFYLCALLQRRLLDISRRWTSSLYVSLCLGASIFFLRAAHSYHYGAIIALAFYSTIHAAFILFPRTAEQPKLFSFHPPILFPQSVFFHQRFKLACIHTTLLLVLPFCTYRFTEMEIWKAFSLKPDLIGSDLTCYVTATDVLGTSSYEQIENWYDYQCPQIDQNERQAFAIRKLLHEITHDPREYLLHLERKNRVLAMPNAYLEWSTQPAYESWDSTHDQVKRVNLFRLDAQNASVSIVYAFLLLLVICRVLLYPRLPTKPTEAIPLVFSAAYYGVFLFLLESQPRYNVFMIFAFSWMAARALDYLNRWQIIRRVEETPRYTPTLTQMYAGGIIFIALIVGAFGGVSRLIADTSFTLRDQTGFAPVPPSKLMAQFRACPEVTPVFVRNNFKQLMIGYPVGTAVKPNSIMVVQHTFAIKRRPSHHLRFFLSTYAVRNQAFLDKVTWKDTNIEYFLAVNGLLLRAGKVNDIPDNLYLSFHPDDNLVFTPRMTLQLILRNTAEIKKVGPTRGPVVSLEYIDLQ